MLLEDLCQLSGVSGNEDEVRNFICKEIEGNCDYKIDALGNIIAFKKGNKTPAKKLMIAAHMDEVGLIVTSIKADGTLRISPVGGIDAGVVIGRQVSVGEEKLIGVIGAKAVHNLTADEKKTAPTFSNLYVDIGATSKDEAQDYVKMGDVLTFKSDFIKFGNDRIKGKAIDDRAGCAIMIEMIKDELEYDTTFVFTVQEEIGTRGAKVSTFTVNPDFAIVLETTTAADIPIASEEKRVCEVGKGAVVSYMDRGTIYDRELYKLAFLLAEENDIPIQTKTMVAGGNDSGAIHLSNGGVRTIAISAPCRYLHSPSCVVKGSDLTACKELAKCLMSRICEL